MISGELKILRLGKQFAWANFILFVVYDLIVIAGIISGKGLLIEPYLTAAEAFTIAGAMILLPLIATIHQCAPPRSKVFSLTAFAWMILLAGFTSAVHFVNLSLGKQIDQQQKNDLIRLIGWEWPSLLFSIELAAWHLFFGLSIFFAAFAFREKGKERLVRNGFLITGLLCVIGLIGPLSGNQVLRTIGIFGYGILFPAFCIPLAGVFKNAASNN